MGVFIRPDSPYFWLWIPPQQKDGKPIGKGTRERTNVLALEKNRHLADKLYESRMHSLALQTYFVTPPHKRHRRATEAGWTYVYFATDGTHIKIGRAIDVVKRLKNIQTAQSKQIVIVATLLAHASVERLIHRKFRHLRLRKTGEWFEQAPELQAFIEEVRAGHDVVSGLVPAFALPRGISRPREKRATPLSSDTQSDPAQQQEVP